MPITNNVDLLNYYDNDQTIQVPQQSVSNPAWEHAAHCMAFETLRGILGLGVTIDEYNTMDTSAWDALVTAARARMVLNPASAAPGALMTNTDIQSAANLGGNYFEHQYTAIIDHEPPPTRKNFTRTGTVG